MKTRLPQPLVALWREEWTEKKNCALILAGLTSSYPLILPYDTNTHDKKHTLGPMWEFQSRFFSTMEREGAKTPSEACMRLLCEDPADVFPKNPPFSLCVPPYHPVGYLEPGVIFLSTLVTLALLQASTFALRQTSTCTVTKFVHSYLRTRTPSLVYTNTK